MIQRSKQRYSDMLWNMRSITMHNRSYGHPLHPDLTPDVLTCVLPLGTVSSGKEGEVESAQLFLTIIHFFQRMSSYFSTHKHLHTQLNHNTFNVCVFVETYEYIYVEGIYTLIEYTQRRFRSGLEYLHFWVHERERPYLHLTTEFT